MAKHTKHKHIKQQKEAAAEERIIHITHVLNKYSGIEVLSRAYARGGVLGFKPPPPIGLSTKMHNKENVTFFALLRLFFAMEWTKSDLKHLLKHKFSGERANFSKTKPTS